MASSKLVHRYLAATSLAALAALMLGPTLAASASSRKVRAAPVARHSLLQSRLLWATIDVCSPSDQPDTLGIRGSMPGYGRAHDTMYMSFHLQYLNAATNSWTDLGGGATSGFV
jgi:hypothetical protein